MRQAGEITMTVRRVARDIRVLRHSTHRPPIVRIRLRPVLARSFAPVPGALQPLHPADFAFLRRSQPTTVTVRTRAGHSAPRYETRLALTVACHVTAPEADAPPAQIRESRPAPLMMRLADRTAPPGSGTIAAAHPLLPRLAQVLAHAPVTPAPSRQDAAITQVLTRASGPSSLAMTVRRAAPATEAGPKPPAEPPRRAEPPAPDPRAIRAMALAPDVIRAVSDQVVTAIDRRMLARREQFGRV